MAKINFTGEFIRLAENSDGGRLALKALVLTCTQFEGIEGVEIYVDGEAYDPGADTLALPASPMSPRTSSIITSRRSRR